MKNVKNIWTKAKPIAVLLLILTVIVVAGIAMNQQQNKTCKQLEIVLEDHGNAFMDEADILAIIENTLGNNPEGEIVGVVDVQKVEDALQENPYVNRAEIYYTVDNRLKANLELAQPVVRIINTRGVHYYLDVNSNILPRSAKFTPRVLVANGFIDFQADTLIHEKLVNLVTKIQDDMFWNALIEQVYVNSQKEVELIPKFGADNILLGAVDKSMDEKFRKLKIFYLEGLKNVGWNIYETINLKYEDQVICTKK